jgi:hypothetical protein
MTSCELTLASTEKNRRLAGFSCGPSAAANLRQNAHLRGDACTFIELFAWQLHRKAVDGALHHDHDEP